MTTVTRHLRSTGKADGDPDKSPDPVGNDDPDKLPDRLFFGNLFYTLVPLCAIALVHVLVMWSLPLLGMSVPEKLDGNPQIEVLVVQIASMGLLQSSWGCIVYSDSTTVMRILAVFVLIALCVFNGCYYSMIMKFVGELGGGWLVFCDYASVRRSLWKGFAIFRCMRSRPLAVVATAALRRHCCCNRRRRRRRRLLYGCCRLATAANAALIRSCHYHPQLSATAAVHRRCCRSSPLLLSVATDWPSSRWRPAHQVPTDKTVLIASCPNEFSGLCGILAVAGDQQLAGRRGTGLRIAE